MKPQITVGLVEFGTVVAYVLLMTIMWRGVAAALLPNHPRAARAMASIYS